MVAERLNVWSVEPQQGPRDAEPDIRPLIADSATAMRSLAIRTPCLCSVLITHHLV